MNPEAHCKCCSGSGQVPTGYYVSIINEPLPKWVPNGKTKDCPGCDGSGVSVRAQKWRDEHPGEIPTP